MSKDPEVRRQELIVAAYELFREKGFEQVSVSDIVKKVGLAQGTFYYHFKTKNELLDAVVDYDMRKEPGGPRERSWTMNKLDPLEKMQAVIDLNL